MMGIGTKCITTLWVCLTILLSAAITVALLSPVWFKNETKINLSSTTERKLRKNEFLTFGLLRYCKRDQLHDVLFQCEFYDIFNGMPSIAWIVCGSLFCIGMLLFVLCVVLSVFGCCLRRNNGAKCRAGLAYIQTVGGMFVIYDFDFLWILFIRFTRFCHRNSVFFLLEAQCS